MCLTGLTFVISGVLESLERSEAADLVKKYGGRVTGSVSGKTSYLVAGMEAGESKTSKAKAKNIPIIDEDALFEIIKNAPEGGTPTKGKPAAKKRKTKTPAKKKRKFQKR